MSRDLAHRALSLARAIEDAAPDHLLPPSDIAAPKRQPVVPHSLFAGTRGYIEKIVYQVNATYEVSCYDACAVMIRRLIEILVIECFDSHGMTAKITNSRGDILFLQDLIAITLSEPSWHLGRNAKAGLTKLKTIGDQSAHSRRYNARREYIDDMIIDVRTVSEELLYLSGLRK